MLKIYGAKTFNAVKAVLTAEEAGVDYEYVTMDFFRFDEKGTIVDHWDARYKITVESATNNTMI